MQKNVSYTKTLESKIIGSQYETAPSLQKHKIENHFDKKSFFQTAKENTEKEIKNPAEESALKAEQEFFEMQEKKNKIKDERRNHVKRIIKEKMIIEKKAKFKEFIKQRNKKSFSKEKKDKYNEEIRRKVIEKKRSTNNANLNFNSNCVYVNNNNNNNNNGLNPNENFVIPEDNKELFYHTIRVNENGDLKTNMVINEYENYDVDKYEQADFRNNIMNNANKLINNNDNNDFEINDNSQNIKIKYDEADSYDFDNCSNNNFNMNLYNNNNKNSNDFNCCYEKYNKQTNELFTQDPINFLAVESGGNPILNNLYYATTTNNNNNDSFNIFKENQELLNKQIRFNNEEENVIIEENENDIENEEILNDESNKDKDLLNNIIEKTKENDSNNQSSSNNVINLRDDMQQKLKEKLKAKQKELSKKNPFYKEKNEISDENKNNNSSSKIRDFLANSKLTFGENLTQDIYNVSSAYNQISSCNEINFSGLNCNSVYVNGNLISKKNPSFVDKNAKNKSFDSINLHLNVNNGNTYKDNNYNNNDYNQKFINDVDKEKNQIKINDAGKVKEIDMNKYLDRKVTKIKAFRKTGTFSDNINKARNNYNNNYNNTEANCYNLNDGFGKDSFNSYYNTENSSSCADSDLIENGYRTYSIALENKKREMLKYKSKMSLTGKSSNAWDNVTNMNKIIKRKSEKTMNRINDKFKSKADIIPNICSCGQMQKKLNSFLIDHKTSIYTMMNNDCANNCIYYNDNAQYQKAISDVMKSIKSMKFSL